MTTTTEPTEPTGLTARDRLAGQRAVTLGLIQGLPNGDTAYLAPEDLRLIGDELREGLRIVDYQRVRWQQVAAAARQVLDARFA